MPHAAILPRGNIPDDNIPDDNVGLGRKPSESGTRKKKHYAIYEHRCICERHFFIKEKFILNVRTVFLTLRDNHSKRIAIRNNGLYLEKLLKRLYCERGDP